MERVSRRRPRGSSSTFVPSGTLPSRKKRARGEASLPIDHLRVAADPKLSLLQRKQEEEEVRQWEEQRQTRLASITQKEPPFATEEKDFEGGNQLRNSPKQRIEGIEVYQDSTSKKNGLSSVIRRAKEEAGMKISTVPSMFLEAKEIHLEVWSPLVDDKCLTLLAEINERKMREGITPGGSDPGSLLRTQDAKQLGAINLLQNIFPTQQLAPAAGENAPPSGQDESTNVDEQVEHGSVRIPYHGMETLMIPHAEQVTDNGMLSLARACTSLRKLNIAGCHQLTDVSLRALAKQNPRLQELNLSECYGIQGSGLVTVGECCRQLRVLRMKSSPASEEWLLRRIATGLPELVEIDLSNSSKVSDDTLRTLANRCVKLEKIVLANCKEVSDVGVLAISEYCHGLEYLDLTRTKLKHKVTDVCLLSLAERCHALTTLVVAGNDFITDVGLSWLASGCHALEKLNVSNCFKVTDIGLRALGEGCPDLKWLDLTGLEEITDVGIRNIAEGCAKLEFLNCTHLYLLTDGVDRDFGVQGLQLMSSTCLELEHVILNGCFQVGPRILKNLAWGIDPLSEVKSLKHGHKLKTLSLKRLPKINAAAIAPLLQGPTADSLTVLNLAECEMIRDKLLQLVGRHCSSIRILNVSRCSAITPRGISALCRGPKAKSLRELDVSFCQQVNDLAMLSLSEAKFDPGLAKLNLRGCDLVSETGVAWLGEGLKSLMELNLKGCSGVTLRGLKAMIGNWNYVQVKNEADFFGFAPEDRCADMRFIDEYGSIWKAAILIQNTYRSKVARRDAERRREERLKNWTARKLQSYYRGRMARKYALLKRLQRDKERDAAVRLQCAFRSRKAREKTQAARERAYQEKCERAALYIQTRWRGKLSRDVLSAARAARRDYLAKCEKAAIKVQRIWRGLEGRRNYTLMKAAWLANQAAKEDAANKLQSLFRGRQARKDAAARKRLDALEEEKKIQASILVQKAARGRIARKKLLRKREEEEKREAAAVKLQCLWRAKKGSLAAHMVRQARKLQQLENAALRVQTAWRKRQGKLASHLLKMAKLSAKEEQNDAARRLQCLFRQRKARRKAVQIRSEKLDVLQRQHDLDVWAATMVQKVFRGKRGRKRAQIVQEEKMRRWKEMFDYEQDRLFYYNQDTGEVRWRMPQDLLDLLPKPGCTNCSLEDAYVECGICSEFFCETCWGQVHFGGFRKDHSYRALYDAYGKRIDYGDGEWPSIWPTEIEQDDQLGWQRMKRAEQAERGEPVTVGIPGLDPSFDRSKSHGDDDESVVSDEDEMPSDGEESLADDNKGNKGETTKKEQRWRKLWDYDNDCEIYIDAKRKRVRFDRPKSYESPRVEESWKEYFDDTFQVTYYYNHKTGESTYTCPDCLLDEEGLKRKEIAAAWTKGFDERTGKAFFHNDLTGISTFERPGDYQTPREEREREEYLRQNCPWKKYVDDESGLEYYYNHVTGVSQYEVPPDYYPPKEINWLKLFDESSGREYYYCENTGESQFMRPDGFTTPRLEGFEEGKNGWYKYPDPSSGFMVYENYDGRVQYERPLDFDMDNGSSSLDSWKKSYDANGIPFYYNEVSGESSYDPPSTSLSQSGQDGLDGFEASTEDQEFMELNMLTSSMSFAEDEGREALEPPSDWNDTSQVRTWLLEFKENRTDLLEIRTVTLRPEVREVVIEECDKLDLDAVTQGFGRMRRLLITRAQ